MEGQRDRQRKGSGKAVEGQRDRAGGRTGFAGEPAVGPAVDPAADRPAGPLGRRVLGGRHQRHLGLVLRRQRRNRRLPFVSHEGSPEPRGRGRAASRRGRPSTWRPCAGTTLWPVNAQLALAPPGLPQRVRHAMPRGALVCAHSLGRPWQGLALSGGGGGSSGAWPPCQTKPLLAGE